MQPPSVTFQPHSMLYRAVIELALSEDLGTGDITTEITTDPASRGKALVVVKQEAVMAGGFVARDVFHSIDPELKVKAFAEEGEKVPDGMAVMEVEGLVSSILLAERTALNFLQHLSGIATLARKFSKAVEGLPCRVVDTRKTTPGMRVLEKYAVRAGGCGNHRMDLSSGVLIKDNHIAACGSVDRAVKKAKASAPHGLRIQVEVADIKGVEDAIRAGADALLLDNMEIPWLKKAVATARMLSKRVILEASGGIMLENVRQVAETGVDIISCGALTHSARAVDLSLRLL